MTTTTRHTNPQAEFSRLFCLAAAVILNEMPPANESAEEQQQRMETIARIIAADERTKALRSDPNADAITLRANAMYWRETADELAAHLKERKLIS